MQQHVVSQKMAFQTTDTATQANLIWYTLVHKWLKIGPGYDPPTGHSSDGVNNSVAFARWQQRPTIKLGIAMHF